MNSSSTMNSSVAASAKARSMFEEISKFATLSSFIYMLAEFRQMSLLGEIPISFEELILPSDGMNYIDIIKGKPHLIPAYSPGGGMQGMKVFMLAVKIVLADYEELKRSPETKSYVEGCKAFNFLNGLCRKSLKNCERSLDRDKAAKSNVYYIRRFLHNLKSASEHHESCLDFLRAIKDGNVAAMVNLIPSVSEKLFKPCCPLRIFSFSQKENDRRIVWMNDRMAHRECVYTIVVSRRDRCIVIIFRGTTTWSDVLKDIDFGILYERNPTLGYYLGRTDEVEINKGVGEYLFTPRKDTHRTKYNEISDRAHEYGKEFGEEVYSLHVTGHSMGGSLAALFAFYASSDSRFAQQGNPVHAYSFCPSIPGRISFARAFQHQERAGLLRHIRVVNKGDVVPLAHPQSHRTFAHTGISFCLHASKKEIPSIEYIRNVDWWSTLGANIKTNIWLNFPWLNPRLVGKYHDLDTTMQRLEIAGPSLHALGYQTMEDYYNYFAGQNGEKSKLL
mmetsp:Transcript_24548/g.38016  ORF Transcript_24548/g.38016 Transcript_24548/m.38016 type:complete len:504 (-) Transcript_24548:290-1801(-)